MKAQAEARSKAAEWKRDASGLFEKRWYAYAVAGAGALMAAPSAHGAIVYSGLLNTTVTVSCNTNTNCPLDGSTIPVSLAGADGNFSLNGHVSSSLWQVHFNTGANTPGTLGSGGANGLTHEFAGGQSIGPLGGFSFNNVNHTLNTEGTWDSADGFIGLEFHLSTDPLPTDQNFAWAHIQTSFINSTTNESITITLVDFAYESSPGVAIFAGVTGVTPEPATAGLALLGLGACGLAAWRKRKQAAAA